MHQMPNRDDMLILRHFRQVLANVIIQRKQQVLTVPERAVTFRNDSAFVMVATGPEKNEERLIKTGLSDAINIEVISGLKEGDEVEEKPVKKIE